MKPDNGSALTTMMVHVTDHAVVRARERLRMTGTDGDIRRALRDALGRALRVRAYCGERYVRAMVRRTKNRRVLADLAVHDGTVLAIVTVTPSATPSRRQPTDHRYNPRPRGRR